MLVGLASVCRYPAASMRATILAAVASLALLACNQLHDDMRRAEDHYASAHYDSAESWLVEIEPRVTGMSLTDQARFYYLRGMTAYRLQKTTDARHYLALARELNGDEGQLLGEGWTSTLNRTLAELFPDGFGEAAPR